MRLKTTSSRERWLISYADMLTLLFAIFVFLYSLNRASQSDQDTMKQLSASMRVAFKAPFEEIPQEKRIAPQEAGVGVFDYFKGNKLRPDLVETFPTDKGRDDVIEKDMVVVKTKILERLYGPQNVAEKGDKGQERIINVYKTKQGFSLRLAGRFFFQANSYHLDKDALNELSEVSKVLKELGRPILVEAHTDSVQVPNAKFNKWELSSLRAATVVDYLINKHNFPKSRLSSAAYADIRPLTNEKSQKASDLNQRVEIQIRYEDPSYTEL